MHRLEPIKIYNNNNYLEKKTEQWTLAINFNFRMKFSYFFATWWCTLLILKTYTIYNRTHGLKCQSSTTLGFKDINIKKSEFVASTQFSQENIVKQTPEILLSNLYKGGNQTRPEPPLCGSEPPWFVMQYEPLPYN